MIPFIVIGGFIDTIKNRTMVKVVKYGSKLNKILAIILLYVGIELALSSFGIVGLIAYI